MRRYTHGMTRRPLAACVLTSAGLLAALGCANQNGGGAPADARTNLQPADFTTGESPDSAPHEDVSRALRADDAAEKSGDPGARQQPPMETGPSAPRDNTPTSPGSDAAPRPGAGPATASASLQNPSTYVLDAMVGQVNGKAIYADTVLEPIAEQLGALGRQLPPAEFRQRARQLIASTIDQIVQDSLILGEADRDLSDKEREGLKQMVQRKREEILRQHGQGSLSLTEYTLQRDTGKSLDQTLNDYRQQVVVSRYLRERLFPRINVTRRDVERYYREHEAEFATKDARVLRLIRVQSDSEAEQIREKLQSEPFPVVATDKLNLYKPTQGGVMEEVSGPAAFDSPELNEAVAKLRQGEWAGPIAFRNGQVFVYLEKLTQQPGKTLEQAQVEIDKLLREQQYRELSSDERSRMMKEGSFTPVDQMTDALVQIAVSRYAAR